MSNPRAYIIANRTDRCTEYLAYSAVDLAEALTMAERDGVDAAEIMPEDAAELADWPADYTRPTVHAPDYPIGTCLMCGAAADTAGRLCRADAGR